MIDLGHFSVSLGLCEKNGKENSLLVYYILKIIELMIENIFTKDE